MKHHRHAKRERLESAPQWKFLVSAKHQLLTFLYNTPILSRQALRLLNGLFFCLEKVPALCDRIPLTSPQKNHMTYLPVNKGIRQTAPPPATVKGTAVNIDRPLGEPMNEIVPLQVLHQFIDRAEIHVIMDRCICRTAFECSHFSNEIGCLFMGETALKLPPELGRRVNRKEAHAHAEKASSAGLVPLTGKVNVDNLGFLTPDTGRLLSVCFCCHCCCMMGYYRHSSDQMQKLFKPIDGLVVLVTENCRGCGSCIETCRFDAISLQNGRAVHAAHCVGCGRCQSYCPNQAVSISVANPNYVEDVVRRVGAFVEIDSPDLRSMMP